MIGGPQSEFLTDWAEGMGMKIFNMKQNNRKIKTKKRERKEGIKKKRKKKKTTDTQTNTLEQKQKSQKSKWFTMGGHKRQDPKSRKYPLTCHPLAVNSL